MGVGAKDTAVQEVFFGSLPRSDLQVQELRADSELERVLGLQV
jgi:hypothetical protein